MARTFVIGDIHGAHRALTQCFERSGFDFENDDLICLGDVCDGWPETRGAIDELLKVKHLTYLLGNHDAWALEWMEKGTAETIWRSQGGQATIDSYRNEVPEAHIELLRTARLYYAKEDKAFVHASFDPEIPLEHQEQSVLIWDRTLPQLALDFHFKNIHKALTSYDEVYLGHTPIPFPSPLYSCGVWLMDTGAGWNGVLSMMDVHSKDTFISDPVPELYPGVPGRTRI